MVTMSEVIDNLEAQELEADLVLGGDEGKECTYPLGYLSRQAVFSCLTCCPEGNAGVCTACSMTCHDGHEVVELWTRRRFRCDCGNSKFGVGVCRIFSSKDAENCENVYNQNYKGVYCTCKRPYPDPDGEDQGEMLQCCICEDWFHDTHLGLGPAEQVPRDEEGEPLFDELICQTCAVSLDFLLHYSDLLVPITHAVSIHKEIGFNENNGKVKQEPIQALGQVGDPTVKATASHGNENSHSEMSANLAPVDSQVDGTLELLSNPGVQVLSNEKEVMEPIGQISSGKLIDVKNSLLYKGESVASSCRLELLKNSEALLQRCEIGNEKHDSSNGTSDVWTDKALFLVKNWRTQLCRCDACCNVYMVKGVSFLLDSADTLLNYEEVAKQKRKDKMEAAEKGDLAFLNSLGHVGQIEFLHELNDMTSEFSSHFASFGESGRTITSDDIHEFFDNLKRKRMRLV